MDQAQKFAHGENVLEAAEAELAQAKLELEKAERHVEKAERDIAKAIEQEKRPHQFEVTVLYNGVKKPFEVRRDEIVKTLLNDAIRRFRPDRQSTPVGPLHEERRGTDGRPDHRTGGGETARRAALAAEFREGRIV